MPHHCRIVKGHGSFFCAFFRFDELFQAMLSVEELLREKYSGKKGLRESNQRALRLGYEYVKNNFDCPLPFHLAPAGRARVDVLLDAVFLFGRKLDQRSHVAHAPLQPRCRTIGGGVRLFVPIECRRFISALLRVPESA